MNRERSDYHWLDTVEGFSLIGAVLGTGAGFISQQVMYASAPVTLALVMNFVNRQRHQQRIQQLCNERIANTQVELERRFEDRLQRLNEASISAGDVPATATFDTVPSAVPMQGFQISAVSNLERQMKDLAAKVAAVSGQRGVTVGEQNGSANVAIELPPTLEEEEHNGHLSQFWQDYESGSRSFVGIDLSGANLSGSHVYLDNIDLSSANLEGTILTAINLGNATFDRANLKEAQLDNTNLARADLIDAILTGANLKGANLRGANLQRADLQNVDLSYADLTHANLEGARLENAKLYRTRTDGLQVVPLESLSS